MRGLLTGGDGLERERGLLLCIEDIDDEGVMNSELRARLRFPSMF